MQDDPSADKNVSVSEAGSKRRERASIARIARQLEQLDGLALDNAPERRRLARWIVANFTPKG